MIRCEARRRFFSWNFEHTLPSMLDRLVYPEDCVSAVPHPVPPPSLYFTIAPNDADNLLTLAFCRPNDKDLLKLTVAERFMAITSNSPAAALVFQRQMQAVFVPYGTQFPHTKNNKFSSLRSVYLKDITRVCSFYPHCRVRFSLRRELTINGIAPVGYKPQIF